MLSSYIGSNHHPQLRVLLAFAESSMVTVEAARPIPKAAFEAPSSSPRISFSTEFLDEKMGFVSIGLEKSLEESHGAAEFEFLSTNASLDSMLSVDELFREGKLLPKFWLAEHCDDKSLEKDGGSPMIESKPWKDEGKREEEWRSCNMNLDSLVDEDPSTRPPNCTILWKEFVEAEEATPRFLFASVSFVVNVVVAVIVLLVLFIIIELHGRCRCQGRKGRREKHKEEEERRGTGEDEFGNHEDQADDQRADMYGGKRWQVAASSFPLEEGESGVVITKKVL